MDFLQARYHYWQMASCDPSARSEGMSLSAWLRSAALQRLREKQRSNTFESPADLEEFFRSCDGLEGRRREPDWEDHMGVMDESRQRGSSKT